MSFAGPSSLPQLLLSTEGDDELGNLDNLVDLHMDDIDALSHSRSHTATMGSNGDNSDEGRKDTGEENQPAKEIVHACILYRYIHTYIHTYM